MKDTPSSGSYELPAALPQGRVLLAEGREIGAGIETGVSAYCADM